MRLAFLEFTLAASLLVGAALLLLNIVYGAPAQVFVGFSPFIVWVLVFAVKRRREL